MKILVNVSDGQTTKRFNLGETPDIKQLDIENCFLLAVNEFHDFFGDRKLDLTKNVVDIQIKNEVGYVNIDKKFTYYVAFDTQFTSS